MGLRVTVYDATGRGSHWSQPGLTMSWQVGARLYQHYPRRQRVDAVFAATCWTDALAWLASVEPGQPIDEIQYWGHGLPGRIFIGTDVLTTDALQPGAALADDLDAVVARLSGPDALVWFRTCGAFGGTQGQAFATASAARFRCRVAGHTFVIGPLQSGLHTVSETRPPTWSVREGQNAKGGLLPSSVSAPNTITCLQGAVPAGW